MSTDPTIWTIRAALLLYVAAVVLMLRARRCATLWPAARWVWTAGFLAYAAHVLWAFGLHHDWSHAAAVEATARQTRDVVGVSVGVGVWFNHVFTLAWFADVTWWWRTAAAAYARRRRWITAALHGYMAFIAVNATVVFESGPVRWAGAAACVAVAGAAWVTAGQTRRTP